MASQGKSSYDSQLRRIQFFPNHKYHQIFIALCFDNIEDKSELATRITKQFIDSLSEKERQRLLELYKKLTPEQVRNPGSLKNRS